MAQLQRAYFFEYVLLVKLPVKYLLSYCFWHITLKAIAKKTFGVYLLRLNAIIDNKSDVSISKRQDEHLHRFYMAVRSRTCTRTIFFPTKLLPAFLLSSQIMSSKLLLRVQPESTISHRNRERIIYLFQYKSTSRSKLYLNPLQRRLENAKKRPLVC